MNDRITTDVIAMPEFNELEVVLGSELAHRLAPAPGGWRTLSPRELEDLGLSTKARARVQSLQRLAQSRPPSLPFGALANAETVGSIYKERIGGLDHERVLALALDGRNHVVEELELARGGVHGAALTPGDVFRPLVRASASAAILVHNHPSGDPHPSPEDVAMTRALAAVAPALGLSVLDHVIVARESWTSLLDLGAFDDLQEKSA